jgi:hypothetical protein
VSLVTLPPHLLLRGYEATRRVPAHVQRGARGVRDTGRDIGHALAERLTLDALARRHRAQRDRAEEDAREGLAGLGALLQTLSYRPVS